MIKYFAQFWFVCVASSVISPSSTDFLTEVSGSMSSFMRAAQGRDEIIDRYQMHRQQYEKTGDLLELKMALLYVKSSE